MTPVKVTTKTFRAIVTFFHSWMKRKVSNYFLSWKNTSITLIPMVSFFLTREVRTFFLRYQKPLSEATSSDRGTTRESISVLFRRCPLWRSEIITLFWVRRKTKLPKVTHGHHLAHFHRFFFLTVPLDPSFWTLGASGLAEVYWAQKRCRCGHQPTKNLRWVMSVCFSLKLSS